MAKSAFEHRLEELQRSFGTLQSFAAANPDEARRSSADALVGLRRSMRDLESAVGRPVVTASAPPLSSDEQAEAASGRAPRVRRSADPAVVLVRHMTTGDECGGTNQAWCERSGSVPSQLLGTGWLDAVHPDDRARCVASCREALDSNVPRSHEYRLRDASGDHAWVLEICTPRDGASGLLCTAIDIGARKHAETRLAQHERIARALAIAATTDEAASAVVRILCELASWDVGEAWSVGPGGCALHGERRWPAASELGASGDLTEADPAVGVRTTRSSLAPDASLVHESATQRLAMGAMFCLPVTVHGEVRMQLRFYAREARRGGAGIAELMSDASVELGQYLERRRCEERMHEAETRREALLDASFDGWITIDGETHVVELNKAAERIFGYPRDEAVGRDLVELLVPQRMRQQALSAFLRYQADGEAGSRMSRFDAFAMKKDGSEVPVEVGITPLEPPLRAPLALHVRDASARASAEREIRQHRERQRSLMADLLLAEELERRRLAIDLHDGLTQTIALAQMKLSAIRLSMDTAHAPAVDEIQSLIEQANRAARSISFELSPPVLHDLGLEPAVQWLVENIQGRYHIAVTLEDDGASKPTEEKTRVILFRAIRELLINSAKHSKALHTKVTLARNGNRIAVVVSDDGVGMETEPREATGFGLFSIHERLGHIGGSMHIETSPGHGTTVRLDAPLAAHTTAKVEITP